MQQNPTNAGVSGAFKVPTLRNTEFTGPYFHNGGQATLDQVVAFYSRGGDNPADINLGPGVQNLSLSASDQAALVAFLKALSDDRVRFEQAPFDHPQLCVPNGEQFAAPGVLMPSGDKTFLHEAADRLVEIPEVGASGGLQLQSFAELIGQPRQQDRVRTISRRPAPSSNAIRWRIPMTNTLLKRNAIAIAFVAFSISAAIAQTVVSQPTSVTLWAGTQDFNQFGLASLTFPSAGVILQGTAMSPATGKPVRHLWYGDSRTGFAGWILKWIRTFLRSRVLAATSMSYRVASELSRLRPSSPVRWLSMS